MSERREPPPPGALLRWVSWFYLALAIGAVVWIGVRGGAIDLALFFERRSWLIDAATGVAAAAVLVGLWHLGRRYLPSARALESSMAEMIGPLTTAEAAALALLSGFSEELFFRGAVQSAWGIVPATVVFALLHIGPGREYRIWTLFALIAGVGLGSLMLWRENLLAPVVAHILVNLFGLLRLGRQARGAGDP